MSDQGAEMPDDVAPLLMGLIDGFLDARSRSEEDPEGFLVSVRELLGSCPESLREKFLNFLWNEGVPEEWLDPILPEGTELSIMTTYKILGHRGSGGMGRVYIAYDTTLDREVALKVMRTVTPDGCCNAAEDRDHFLGEARITAGLGHPSVPAVYGATRAGAGGPTYYAMRLVEEEKTVRTAIGEIHVAGRRDRAFASPKSRHLIRYLQGVCEAVAQAHARGFVHRDLKPDNIALDAEERRAWVLDWGLARQQEWLPATPPDYGETVYGTIAGTLPYMSPEQASGREPCGPSSDVYSLGAILYHILTGEIPFAPLAGEAPISKMSLHGKILQGDLRPPGSINRFVPNRLERICRKAMAKNPRDRFASGVDLARELQRWLENEPPLLVSEPLPERAHRVVARRHPERTIAVAVALAAVAGLSWAFTSARASRLEGEAKRDAEIARVTRMEGRRTQAIYQFLDEDLQAAKIAGGMNRNTTLAQALDQVVPRIGARFGNDPESEARVCIIIANKYRFLGMFDRAEPLAHRSVGLRLQYLGPDDWRTVVAETDLAGILGESGKLDEAEPMIRANLQDCRRKLGEGHLNTSAAMVNLATLLVERARQESMKSYAILGHGVSPSMKAAWDEAEMLLEGAVEIQKKESGPDDIQTLATINNLASLLTERGSLADTDPSLASAAETCRTNLGGEHPLTIAMVNNLLTLRIKRQEEVKDAELDNNLEVSRRVMGKADPLTRAAISNIVNANLKPGNLKALSKAEPYARDSWLLLETDPGPDHPATLIAAETYARILQHQGKHRQAEPLLRDLIERRRRPNHPPQTLGLVLQAHGWALLESGDPDAAERDLIEAKKIFDELKPRVDLFAALVDSVLIDCWTSLARFDRAEKLVSPTWPIIEAMPAYALETKIRTVDRIIRLYVASGKPGEAAVWRAKRAKLAQPASN